jgi:hypothetical protein
MRRALPPAFISALKPALRPALTAAFRAALRTALGADFRGAETGTHFVILRAFCAFGLGFQGEPAGARSVPAGGVRPSLGLERRAVAFREAGGFHGRGPASEAADGGYVEVAVPGADRDGGREVKLLFLQPLDFPHDLLP